MGNDRSHQFPAQAIASAVGVDDDVEHHRVVGVVCQHARRRDEFVSVVVPERNDLVRGGQRPVDVRLLAVSLPVVGPVQ
ncbi:MAG: hypothetical protein V5A55_04660 [Halovenus sp.]